MMTIFVGGMCEGFDLEKKNREENSHLDPWITFVWRNHSFLHPQQLNIDAHVSQKEISQIWLCPNLWSLKLNPQEMNPLKEFIFVVALAAFGATIAHKITFSAEEDDFVKKGGEMTFRIFLIWRQYCYLCLRKGSSFDIMVFISWRHRFNKWHCFTLIPSNKMIFHAF
ncbi:uncharacterized protein LOC113304472 [Papaver somniferum]|uniref:uncharacterized protein LOC113304472 n=1 Tax=Papaver somniferum TaxID=3469 RepID=UPI000E6F992E|nr:uncharacterized protein LOC113304472 [Papaver somniferum]